MLDFLSKAYSDITRFHNAGFDNGTKFVYRSKIPVISIGNLSSGGSGKTPLTIYIAMLLLANGIKPGIIGRGYRGNFNGTAVVSDGTHIFMKPEASGDEMYMVVRNVKVPVVINRHKYIAAKMMEQKFAPDCILVDDGFQHRRLARDLDIVIIDENTVANPYILPRGPLREDISALKRADLICYSCHKSELEKLLMPIDKTFELFELKTKTTGLFSVFDLSQNLSKIPSAFVFSGIANPSRFEKSVNTYGISIVGELIFGDHHSYGGKDIRMIIEKTKSLGIKTAVTTEKDAVKLLNFKDMFDSAGIKLLFLKISSEIFPSNKFLNILTDVIKKENVNDER